MIYEIAILVFIIFIGIAGIWFARRFLKNKQEQTKKERNIPSELLEELSKAEQDLKGGLEEDGTTKSPYKILWEIARTKRDESNKGRDGESNNPEQPTANGEVHRQPSGRQDVLV